MALNNWFHHTMKQKRGYSASDCLPKYKPVVARRDKTEDMEGILAFCAVPFNPPCYTTDYIIIVTHTLPRLKLEDVESVTKDNVDKHVNLTKYTSEHHLNVPKHILERHGTVLSSDLQHRHRRWAVECSGTEHSEALDCKDS